MDVFSAKLAASIKKKLVRFNNQLELGDSMQDCNIVPKYNSYKGEDEDSINFLLPLTNMLFLRAHLAAQWHIEALFLA